MSNHRLENYLKNELFEGIIGKMDYLTLYDAETLDKFNTVLISIHDPSSMLHPDTKLQGFADVLQIQFWDIEEALGNYNPITAEQGKEIYNFIEKNKDCKFLVHCAAGQSRSAGVACAVECIVNFYGNVYEYQTGYSAVKSHPRYSPNYTVFDTIVKS
jgi:predicted protein tyrosine phosphatase